MLRLADSFQKNLPAMFAHQKAGQVGSFREHVHDSNSIKILGSNLCHLNNSELV
jgi:hypothetical protein